MYRQVVGTRDTMFDLQIYNLKVKLGKLKQKKQDDDDGDNNSTSNNYGSSSFNDIQPQSADQQQQQAPERQPNVLERLALSLGFIIMMVALAPAILPFIFIAAAINTFRLLLFRILGILLIVGAMKYVIMPESLFDAMFDLILQVSRGLTCAIIGIIAYEFYKHKSKRN